MVDWATVGASVGLSVIGSILVTEFQIRRERSVEESQEIEEWYDETAAYAAEIRRIWQRQWDLSNQPRGNFSELSSELSLLEGQMSRHASVGEQLTDVDQDVVDALDEVANRCRDVSEHTGYIGDDDDIEEYRENILDAVEGLEDELGNRD
jgi:hypothetical protein